MSEWKKLSNGSFDLTVESSPDWFATVYELNGHWLFEIGTRIKKGEKQRCYQSKRSWKQPSTAKQKAKRAILKLKGKL